MFANEWIYVGKRSSTPEFSNLVEPSFLSLGKTLQRTSADLIRLRLRGLSISN